MPFEVLTTPGTGSWAVPAGVTSITVECWGGGGAGGFGQAGGGGAWSSATLSVTPAQRIAYSVASPKPYASNGAKTVGSDTWFWSATTVMAKGSDGHLGGQASASVGTSKFSGGTTRHIDPNTLEPIPGPSENIGGSGASASKFGNGGDGFLNPLNGPGTTGGACPGGGGPGQSNVEGGGGAQQYSGTGGAPGGGSQGATSTRGQIRITWSEGASGDTTPPTITSASAVSVPEGANYTHTIIANEPVDHIEVIGGADMAHFMEGAGGDLLFFAQDYEAPADAGANNTYVVVVRVRDTAGNYTDQTITFTVTDVDDLAPVITSPTSASVAENTVDPSGSLTSDKPVVWSKAGGADAALFSLSGSTWTLNDTPDFEAKATYSVIWRATDSGGRTTDQAFTLTITDVNEGGGSTPWTPADLGQKMLWIDCSDASTITFGGFPNVSRYTDKSGAGRDFTVEQPPSHVANAINGLSASYWLNDRMAFTPIASGTTLTAFFAFKGEAPQTLMTLMGNLDNLLLPIGASNSATNTEVFRGITTPAIRRDGAAATWGNRGAAHSALTSTATQVMVWRGFTLQGVLNRFGAGPFSYYFRGHVGEVIFVQGDPSTADLERVEGYLAHKWGTASALPSNHPYKAAPPTTGSPAPTGRAPRTFNWL